MWLMVRSSRFLIFDFFGGFLGFGFAEAECFEESHDRLAGRNHGMGTRDGMIDS